MANEYTISKIKLPNGDVCNLKDTIYSAGTGIGISGTTISNTGVTGIKGNSESSYRTGQVNLTAANIGAYSTTEVDNKLKKYLPYSHYSNSNSNNDGRYYKISINSATVWMLNFTVKLYHVFRAYDLQISGYNYGDRYWYNPAAIILGASTTDAIDVIFGYDSAYHLWIAIPAQQYTGIDVLNATNGYSQVADMENLFSIELVDGEPTTKQVTITAYRPWYRNETIPVDHGGTGSTTAAGARTNLGLGSIAVKADTDYVSTTLFKATTTANSNLESTTNTVGYVSGLTAANWNYYCSDGAIYAHFYNANWKHQIFGDYRSGQISIRGKNNGTWQNWRRVLDESNARTLLGVTDNSNNADVTSSDTNLITGRTLYYQLAKKGYAPIASPTFTGTPKSVTPSSSSDSKMIATKEYVDNAFAANDAMIFKGTIGSGGTVTSLPAAHNAGWTYRVITAGEYAGIQCEVGDLIICITDGTSANNAHWTVAQTNIDGAVIGPASSTENRLAIFSGTTGKEIKDSGVTLNTSSGSTTKWLTEKGTWTTPTAANVGAVATSAGVTAVTWDSTNKKLTRTINGTAADVVTIGTIKTALNLAKGDVGLGNVTNHAQVTSLQWDTTNKKLTYKVSEGTATNLLTFAAGSNISLTADTNKITIANTYKAPVDSVAGKTGAVTLVKGDVGLDNVDNTADANKTVKYANMLTGFSTRASTMTWGNQTGSVITYLSSAGGGGWGFRDNNPASGQLSMTIDGTIYIKEGAQDISAAIKSLSVSGQTVTWTNLWGTTGTITTQDTKNTAGSTNSTSKLYLIGATSQAANPTTNSYQYTYTNNGLLSALKVGLNLNGTEKAHLEWNNTDQSIDFVFD